MAGLFAGLQYAYGIPFRIECDDWGSPSAWRVPAGIGRAARGRDLFVFWIPAGPDARLVVARLGEKPHTVRAVECAPVRCGWPPIFRWRLLVAHLPADERSPTKSVTVHEGHLLALTAAPGGLGLATGILDRLAQAQKAWETELAFESEVNQLVQQAGPIDFSQLAIVPPSQLDGMAARLLLETGISREAHPLDRRELIDGAVLNPGRYPVLLVAGGEEYVHTVHREGDAKETLLDYLHSGGTLFVCGPGPFPMYYARGTKGTVSDPFLPQVGIPLFTIPDSRSTTGWVIRREKGERVFSRLPEEFPFPASGDRRLRPINREQIPASCSYRPLLSVYDDRGERIGDAAAWLVSGSEQKKPFRAFYVWGPLLKHPEYGREITLAVISELVRAVGTPDIPPEDEQ